MTDSRGRQMPSREVFVLLCPKPLQGPSRADEKPARAYIDAVNAGPRPFR